MSDEDSEVSDEVSNVFDEVSEVSDEVSELSNDISEVPDKIREVQNYSIQIMANFLLHSKILIQQIVSIIFLHPWYFRIGKVEIYST